MFSSVILLFVSYTPVCGNVIIYYDILSRVRDKHDLSAVVEYRRDLFFIEISITYLSESLGIRKHLRKVIIIDELSWISFGVNSAMRGRRSALSS